MSRTFQCTFDDDIAAEIEQYVYGKTGKTVSHWLTDAILGQASKNPLTVPQFNRIVRKYGKATVVRLEPLAVPLDGNKKVDGSA
jgi:hypothetical protein